MPSLRGSGASIARGPGEQLPTRYRHDHRLPDGRWRRRTARRRHRRHRCRDQRLLRLEVGQADLPRAGFRVRSRPRSAGPGRVPGSRREHQHSVPPSGAGGSRFHGRRRLDLLHRGASRSADYPCAGRPRHQAAALAGRGHRQQAVGRGADPPRSRRQAAGRCRSRRAVAEGLPAAAAGARTRGVRRRPAAAGGCRARPSPSSTVS